jgi:hypothetical protein
MFLIYQKSDKKVMFAREDISANPLTKEQALAIYCLDNNVSSNDYVCVEIARVEEISCNFYHLYDEATNTIIRDPSWIEPPRSETVSIPVSDPAGE